MDRLPWWRRFRLSAPGRRTKRGGAPQEIERAFFVSLRAGGQQYHIFPSPAHVPAQHIIARHASQPVPTLHLIPAPRVARLVVGGSGVWERSLTTPAGSASQAPTPGRSRTSLISSTPLQRSHNPQRPPSAAVHCARAIASALRASAAAACPPLRLTSTVRISVPRLSVVALPANPWFACLSRCSAPSATQPTNAW